MNIMMIHLRNIGGVAGGLEKVMCQFSNEMNRRGHGVTMVIYDNSGKPPYYSLDKNVRLINLYDRRHEPRHMRMRSKLEREWARARGKVESWYETYRDPYILPSLQEVYQECRPDVILNQYYSSIGFIYASHPDCPVIQMLHNEPARIIKKTSKRERDGLAHCALIQVLLPGFVKEVKKHFPEIPCVNVPNVVYPSEQASDLASHSAPYTILHVGRLDRNHKQQHILIEAFARIAHDFPEWRVEFWGDGKAEYKEELVHLISANHLETQVKLCGATHHISEKYVYADVFAFPSAYEGWGLALTEAMSAGLPVVAFRSCQACADLVTHEQTGLLSEDGVDAFSDQLARIMKDRDLRIRLGRQARKEMEKYTPDRVWNQWEDILQKIVAEKAEI